MPLPTLPAAPHGTGAGAPHGTGGGVSTGTSSAGSSSGSPSRVAAPPAAAAGTGTPPLPYPLAGAPPEDADVGDPAVATAARLSGDNKRTRLTVDLSRTVDMRAFPLADPYRVVIEIPKVRFDLPADAGDQSQGLVKGFHYGLVKSTTSRVVIDLSGPAKVARAIVEPAADGQPARMVLDLVAVERDTFLRAVAIENRLPRALPAQPAPQTADSRPVVAIDAGHGGVDPGTRAQRSGEVEKDVTLAFANQLRAKLEATGKYRVVMTRSDDTFVELSQRVAIARNQRAQLLISIHCDALPRGEGEAQGATVYTLSELPSDAEAQRLADAENDADVTGGVEELPDAERKQTADILADLAQRETKAFSADFARRVVKEMTVAARMYKHPLKSAAFRILKAPDVPSVLIELGYLSNPRDLKQLVSETWRTRAADAIVHAVRNFFTTTRVAGGTPPRAQ
jgi:N-acetylmuramoyl-L-alanine amidase